MDFYFETVNKHCNFLPQILFPLPLADYKQNKMKENYNLPPNHIGYKVCHRIEVNSLHYKMFTNLV